MRPYETRHRFFYIELGLASKLVNAPQDLIVREVTRLQSGDLGLIGVSEEIDDRNFDTRHLY